MLLDVINACSTDTQLDEASGLLWRGAGQNHLDDNEVTFLAECIEARRPQRRLPVQPIGAQVGRIASRVLAGEGTSRRVTGRSLYPVRRYRGSPDREASRNRRRILGGSSALPDGLRHHYTEGQRAVLCVIAEQVKRRGTCDLAIDAIAAIAGTCRTLVQNTLRIARDLRHLSVTERPRRGAKHLTHLIKIAAADWLAWVRRAPSAARRIGFTISKILCPTESKEKKTKMHSGVSEPFRGHGPPGGGREIRFST